MLASCGFNDAFQGVGNLKPELRNWTLSVRYRLSQFESRV
jgi:hypothetical protein